MCAMATLGFYRGKNPFDELGAKLDQLLTEVHKMAIDQATFDEHLAGLVSKVGELAAAVEAWQASHQGVDLTAEDQAVQEAAASVQAELDALNPETPTEPTA